jgi:hypothetical protein
VLAKFNGRDFKGELVASDEEAYFQTMCCYAAHNAWLRSGLFFELLGMFSHEALQPFEAVKSKLWATDCRDMAATQEVFSELEAAYINVLVNQADEVFAGNLYRQLLWIDAVNDFEDNFNKVGTPLDIIGTTKLAQLIELAKNAAAREMRVNKAIDFEYYKAVKDVHDVLKTCSIAFQSGYINNAYTGFRSIHPRALGDKVEVLKAKHGHKLRL